MGLLGKCGLFRVIQTIKQILNGDEKNPVQVSESINFGATANRKSEDIWDMLQIIYLRFYNPPLLEQDQSERLSLCWSWERPAETHANIPSPGLRRSTCMEGGSRGLCSSVIAVSAKASSEVTVVAVSAPFAAALTNCKVVMPDT